ncbi:MAG: phytanoyl-CoA dioxygenase family protein [Planctomycetota bacterium]|nr:phytanoyl-CoA dioxygenase family protein [Planctomycetota bacterium]
MTPTQQYLFDLQGFLHLPGLLSPDEAGSLLDASQRLERDALACAATGPKWKSVWGPEYWQHPQHGYFAHGSNGAGQTLMVEDFWHFPSAFDFLVGHEPTMKIVRGAVQRDVGINNSELRIRYPGNQTGMHMGHPHGCGPKYRYSVLDGKIDCVMTRMIYFLHDVKADEGVTCFVPASHLGRFAMPEPTAPVDREPGVMGIPVKAGDAIFFTENCRHGGFPNLSDKTRYTLHVGYGPAWLRSQNISTMDEDVHATDALLARLSESQRKLLRRARRAAM